ncbi:MAG: hypothetical protein ACE5IO_05205, partial [Thermoplasmata archaeon]
QDPDKPETTEYLGFGKRILETADSQLDSLRDLYPNNIIEAIGRVYWDSWWEIKKLNGTSAQWPWLAEYFVFSEVKRYIMERLEISFETIPETRYIYKFVDDASKPKHTLLHNAYLPDKIEDKNVQPDVTYFRDGKLVFTMDVKVAVQDSKIMEGVLKKMRNTAEYYTSTQQKKVNVYLVSVAQKLTFNAGDVKDEFDMFKAFGKIVGPKGGSLTNKVKDMGSKLYSLNVVSKRI